MEHLADKIYATFVDCLYRDYEVTPGKIPEGTVVGSGVMSLKVGFHPGRLAAAREDVKSYLLEMHPNFSVGGGWTFLSLCVDKNGVQWGEHVNADQLIMLGSALGMVQFMHPREIWHVLPGSMPYLIIDTDVESVQR